MKVYALVGASGTGKSHHASRLAHEMNISLILDDGLLIQNNRVLAGWSAKREATRIGAAKRALLTENEHAEAIKEKIRELNADRILLISTSSKMAYRLSERLELPPPEKYIQIEEIVPEENIEKALKLRKNQNRHVVPLPMFAIKKDFPGYLMSPLRSIFNRSGQKKLSVERSIVRPVYSTLGNFFIAEQVLVNMVTFICEELPAIYKVNKVKVISNTRGINLEVEVILYMYPNMKKNLQDAQQIVKERIEYLTGFHVKEVNLSAVKLTFSTPEKENNPPQKASKPFSNNAKESNLE